MTHRSPPQHLAPRHLALPRLALHRPSTHPPTPHRHCVVHVGTSAAAARAGRSKPERSGSTAHGHTVVIDAQAVAQASVPRACCAWRHDVGRRRERRSERSQHDGDVHPWRTQVDCRAEDVDEAVRAWAGRARRYVFSPSFFLPLFRQRAGFCCTARLCPSRSTMSVRTVWLVRAAQAQQAAPLKRGPRRDMVGALNVRAGAFCVALSLSLTGRCAATRVQTCPDSLPLSRARACGLVGLWVRFCVISRSPTRG